MASQVRATPQQQHMYILFTSWLITYNINNNNHPTAHLQAALDAQQYAEALRKSLMEGLFDGEDLDVDGEADTDVGKGPLTSGEVSKLLDASAGTAGGTAAGHESLLADLGTDLEQLAGHEVIKNIMDQVCVCMGLVAGIIMLTSKSCVALQTQPDSP